MVRRVRGYHYVIGANGRRRRVYSGGARRVATGRRKTTVGRSHARRDFAGDTIMGYGSYRKTSRSIGHKRGRRTGGSRVKMGNGGPHIRNSNGNFIIEHEEYLGDLNSSTAFSNTPFSINPGLTLAEGGFTNWLPNVAQQFEEWQPMGICFKFRSTSSDAVLGNASNSALGTVSMATDYNVANAAFANKVQMENYLNSCSKKPSEHLAHYVECSRRENPLGKFFIRSGAVPAGADQKFYDLGMFQIAASGQQVAGGAMGELWVSYTIKLLKPRILPGVGGANEQNVNFDHIQIYNAVKTTTGVLPATPFGTSTTVPLYPTTQSTLGGMATGGICTAASPASFSPQPSPTLNNFVGGVPVLVNGLPTGALGNSAANTYYFPPGVSTGNYMISYNSLYGVGGANWTPVLAYSNCKALNLLNADASVTQGNLSSVTSVSCMATTFITVTAANASFSFPGSTGAYSTPTWAEFFVTQLPSPTN